MFCSLLNIAKRSVPRCAFNEPERMLHAFAVDADRCHQHEVEFDGCGSNPVMVVMSAT
jgi:hypothetical protein